MRGRRAGVIVVFAKVPRPGRVKTRMVPPFTPRQAADFYAAMLGDVLSTTAAFSRELDLTPLLAVRPWDEGGALALVAPPAFRIVPQCGPNLAARMAWAVREVAAMGEDRVLLRGSDSPTLGRDEASRALSALDDADLVVSPDRDGGYSLIGLRRPMPGLFDHPMSTSLVLEETLANAAELGLRSDVQELGFDIDVVEDLRWLAAARSKGIAHLCPNTLSYLDDNDLWCHARLI